MGELVVVSRICFFGISLGLINLLLAWWCLSWDFSVGYELRGDTFLDLL